MASGSHVFLRCLCGKFDNRERSHLQGTGPSLAFGSKECTGEHAEVSETIKHTDG